MSLEVLRELSPDEVRETFRECEVRFRRLLRRYLPEWRAAEIADLDEMHLDFVRGSWLHDERKSKMSRRKANTAFGFAFGTLLCKALSMRWCMTRDSWGDTLCVVYVGKEPPTGRPEIVAIDPINYAAKRETVENVEVFADGSRAIHRLICPEKTLN